MFRSRVIVTANIQSRRPRNVVKNPNKNVESASDKDVNKQTNGVSDNITKSVDEITNNDADKKLPAENDKELNVKNDNFDKKINDSVSSDIPVPVTEAAAISDAPASESATSNAAVTDGHVTTDVSDAETAPSEPKKTDSTVSSSLVKALPRACFMRPVPRLDGQGRVRKNSVQGSGASASESEDDSRRHLSVPVNNAGKTDTSDQCNLSISFSNNNHSNVNNNSNNNNNNSNTDNESSATGTKSSVKQKKKFLLSESTRKLAEKRREFQLEYKNSKPDRSKLTMYDLIHYNPSTNPMKQIEISKKPVPRPEPIEEEIVEEDADDPDEGGMPAPQVKVGPDGQLILDEQSLVIERTSTIKQREALARNDAVIDDNIYGSGFYKQRSRMKEWPKWETIKFYKALSTIGTDFSLMKSLFPKRSRKELKRKFKKEERLNGKLVGKALHSDVNFDFDLLKQELETFEQMETSKKRPEKNAPLKQKRAKRRIAVTSLGLAALDSGDPEPKQDQNQTKKKRVSAVKPPKPEPANKKKKKLKRARSVSIHSDEDSAEAGSESDTEIYRPRPTRSGRVPRPKKLRINSKHILDDILGEKTPTDEADTPGADSTAGSKILSLERDENSGADITNVEPGSLVIVSKESTDEPGKTEVQVYMVKSTDDAQNNSASKPDLATEMISVVTKNLITSHRDDLDID